MLQATVTVWLWLKLLMLVCAIRTHYQHTQLSQTAQVSQLPVREPTCLNEGVIHRALDTNMSNKVEDGFRSCILDRNTDFNPTEVPSLLQDHTVTTTLQESTDCLHTTTHVCTQL